MDSWTYCRRFCDPMLHVIYRATVVTSFPSDAVRLSVWFAYLRLSVEVSLDFFGLPRSPRTVYSTVVASELLLFLSLPRLVHSRGCLLGRLSSPREPSMQRKNKLRIGRRSSVNDDGVLSMRFFCGWSSWMYSRTSGWRFDRPSVLLNQRKISWCILFFPRLPRST